MSLSAILTLDVHRRPTLVRELDHLVGALGDIGLKATLFVPASLLEDEDLCRACRTLLACNHELGCHGLTHEPDESFAILPETEQRARLTRATRIFEDRLGYPVTLFRAPAFRLCATTLRVLEELRYIADSSIPSTRLSLLSSDLWSFGYLYAPRCPYHPHQDNAFRRGRLNLWEVPMSCFLVPFSISFLQVFGVRLTRLYLAALKAEGRVTGKPLVYMAHVEDFYPSRRVHPKKKLALKYFLPSKEHGFEARYLLEERNEYEIYRKNMTFCAGLASGNGSGLEFATLGQYVAGLSS